MVEKNIGEYLRGFREKEGMNISQVSDLTKINVNVLKKLEANDLGNLPNKAYVKGFVQSYAKVLKIDIEKAIDVLNYSYSVKLGHPFKSERRKIENEARKIKEEKNNQEESNDSNPLETSAIEDNLKKVLKVVSNKKVYIPLIVLITTVSLIISIYNYMSQKVSQDVAQTNLTIEKKEQEDKTEEPLKDQEANLFEMEAIEKIAQEEDSLKPEESQKEEEKKAQTLTGPIAENEKKNTDNANEDALVSQMRESGLLVQTPDDLRDARSIENSSPSKEDFPFVQFYPMGQRIVFSIDKDQSDLENEELYPELAKNAFQSDKQNVFIIALDGDSWLTFKIDNKEVKSLVLRKGKKLFLQGDLILLFMGNANVTRIFYNNKKIDFETKTGVKSLVFPKEKAPNYELPLFVANKKGVLYTASDYKSVMQEKENDED